MDHATTGDGARSLSLRAPRKPLAAVLVAAVLVMFGSMTSWAVVDVPGGYRHLPGYEGDGTATFGLALMIAILVVTLLSGRAAHRLPQLTTVLLVAAIGCGVMLWIAQDRLGSTLGKGYISLDIGSGLVLALAASVAMAYAAFIVKVRVSVQLVGRKAEARKLSSGTAN